MSGAPRCFSSYLATTLLAAACGHAPAPKAAPVTDPFAAFTQAIPACAERQAGLTVEEVFARDWEPADCVLVRGRLVLDTEPLVPIEGDGARPMLADWIVLGKATVLPVAARGTMQGPYRRDDHALYVDNDYGRPETPDLCAEDDAGELRMPVGQLLRFPLVHREQTSSPAAGPVVGVPVVRVVILGQIREYASRTSTDEIREGLRLGHGFDISRICREGAP